MTNGSLSEDEGMDVLDFLGGFDYQEEMLMSNKETSKFDENFESSPFVTEGSLAALEKICITELLSCLRSDSNAPQMSRSPASIDSDLSAWITYSFMQCSEMSLNSHFLLSKLDRFEEVLYSLMNRYYGVCFDDTNEGKDGIRKSDEFEIGSDRMFGMSMREKEHDVKCENTMHQQTENDTNEGIERLEERKVANLCRFLLGAIDRNQSAELIDSELFCIRIFLLLLSENENKQIENNIRKCKKSFLDGIMTIFSYVPTDSGRIYSNFGENWVDYKANLEENCICSRQCIISGEKKIQILDAGLRIQMLISLFDAAFLQSDDNNSESTLNLTENNKNKKLNSIAILSPSNINKSEMKNSIEINKIDKIKFRNLRSRVLSLGMSCVRAVPLASLSVRTCLFFGAANQRYDITMLLLCTAPHFNLDYMEKFTNSNGKKDVKSIDENSQYDEIGKVREKGGSEENCIKEYEYIVSNNTVNSDEKNYANGTNDQKNIERFTGMAVSHGISDGESYAHPTRGTTSSLPLSKDTSDKFQDSIHFLALSRSEAVSALTGRCRGTFIIRPHDAKDEEFLCFLSFVGLENEGIKHAVIRKDSKISKNSSTITSQKSVKSEEFGENGNENENVFNESEDYTISDSYIFRCGKVGPCDSLSEVLLLISDILPSGLLIDRPLVPIKGGEIPDLTEGLSIPSTPENAQSKSDTRKKSNNVLNSKKEKEESQVNVNTIDANYQFYVKINVHLNMCGDVVQSSTTSFPDDVETSFPDIRLHRATTVASADGSLFVHVLCRLAVKALYKQLTVHVPELETFLSSDADSSCFEYFKTEFHRKKMSTQSIFNKNKNNYTSKNTAEENKIIEKCNFDTSLTCTETLLEPLFQFVIFSDRFLIPLLLPPSPFNSSLSHTLSPQGTLLSEAIVSHLSTPLAQHTYANANTYTQYGQTPTVKDEKEIVFPVPIFPKFVKFPGKGSGNGLDHSVDCFDPSELLTWLTSLLSALNLMESLPSTNVSDGYTHAHNNSRKVPPTTNMESSTNYSNTNTSNGNRNGNGNGRGSIMGTKGGDGNHHVLSGMFAPLKRKGQIFARSLPLLRAKLAPYLKVPGVGVRTARTGAIQDLKNNSSTGAVTTCGSSGYMEYLKEIIEEVRREWIMIENMPKAVSGIPATLSSSSPSSTSVLLPPPISLPLPLPLSLPVSLPLSLPQTPAEEAARMLSWLTQSRILISVNRPADIAAFQTSSLYYRYRDPWAVRVLTDLAASRERAKIGRYFYGPLNPTHNANHILHPLLMRLHSVRCANSTDSAKDTADKFLSELSKTGAEKPVPAIGVNKISKQNVPRETEIISNLTVLQHFSQAENFRKLWETLRAEAWLVLMIAHSVDATERDAAGFSLTSSTPVSNKGGGRVLPQADSCLSSTDAYHKNITQYLYRNSLFARLNLPHRYTALIHVDILGLKEVGGGPAGAMGKGNSSSISLGNNSILGGFSSPASSIEIFSIMRLAKAAKPGGSGQIGGTDNGTKGALLDGSYVTPPKRAELVKLPPGSIACEYSWRDQGTFRFPLPEGVLSLTHGHEAIQGSSPSQFRDEDPTPSGTYTRAQLPTVPFSLPSLHSAPSRLILGLYERTFFADNKLGDLDFNLNNLSDEKAFKGWVALSSPTNKTTNGVWYVHVQIQLSHLLQAIELPPIFSSQKSSKIVSKLKRTNSQPYLQTLNVRTNTNSTTSSSMLDLFGSSNTTSFTSSIPSTPYDMLSHSRSHSTFPTLSDSLFGVQSNTSTFSREKEKQKDASKDKTSDKTKNVGGMRSTFLSHLDDFI